MGERDLDVVLIERLLQSFPVFAANGPLLDGLGLETCLDDDRTVAEFIHAKDLNGLNDLVVEILVLFQPVP
jgi:hypothetical protein